MKKRLRKKTRVGEYQEFGFSVWLRVADHLSGDDQNSLFDDFIRLAIVANGLQCGGGNGLRWDVFVTLDRRGSATDAHRQLADNWLADESSVLEYEVGPLVDAWHDEMGP